jgi:hypothetical protein
MTWPDGYAGTAPDPRPLATTSEHEEQGTAPGHRACPGTALTKRRPRVNRQCWGRSAATRRVTSVATERSVAPSPSGRLRTAKGYQDPSVWISHLDDEAVALERSFR